MWLSVTLVPPSLGIGFPRLKEKSSQLWKGRAVEDALPGKEGGAVELECQECGKEWLRPAGGWEQCGREGGVWLCVTDHVGVTTVKDDTHVQICVSRILTRISRLPRKNVVQYAHEGPPVHFNLD
jgi:hypothetical protein